MLASHPDLALFLCWPDPYSGMDESSLRAYAGRTVIYAGEPGESGPGTAGFRRLLRERRPLPRWQGCEDQLLVYERA